MKHYGKGVACVMYPIGATASSNPSNVIVKVNEDATLTLITGASDCGQGSDTVLSQIAAEEAGIPYENIKLIASDTEVAHYDHGAGASRQTHIAGEATVRAVKKVKEPLLQVAGEMLNLDSSTLDIQNGNVISKNDPKITLPLLEVTKKIYNEEVVPTPIAEASYDPEVTPLDPETGQGKPFSVYTYATHIAEVEVDDETGEVDILRVSAVHDLGIPINPMQTEGQINGGISMGIGYALFEEIVINQQGYVQNPNFVDYVLTTSEDMPEIKIKFVENPDELGPFGAKGIGEPATVPTAPAIANAIFDAVGVRIRDLPITPQKILNALKDVR